MNTLVNLQQRLQALPKIRKGRELEQTYAAHLEKVVRSREQLSRAVAGATNAARVLPTDGYGEVLRSAGQAAGVALRLRSDLDASPERILESAIDKRFTSLNEKAAAASDRCERSWRSEVDAKVSDWKLLDAVIRKVFGTRGAEMASTVTALSYTRVPETEADAKKAQALLNELSEAIAKLGLKTSFGEFLKSVATPQGATLGEAQKHDVMGIIKEHKIEGVFRVKLM